MEKTYQFNGLVLNVYNILTTNHYCFSVWAKGADSGSITYIENDRYGKLTGLRNPEFDNLQKYPPMTDFRSSEVSKHYKRMEKISLYLLERAKRVVNNLPQQIELA